MSRTDKILTLGALSLFVFPIGYLVAYLLITLPIGLVLSSLLPADSWLFTAVDWLGRLAGVGAGIALCAYAWPGRKRTSPRPEEQSNKPLHPTGSAGG